MTITPLESAAGVEVEDTSERLSVVLCGSFHREPEVLRAAFDSLRGSCNVLSPSGLEWLDPGDPFVRLDGQQGMSADQIENEHLDSIRRADFVWLHCPEGYVGTSASMEIGFAHAFGVPVLASELPVDPVFAKRVVLVPAGVDAVAALVKPDPGKGLGSLQAYYERIARRRGWDSESARDTLLLLTEEVGEVARAVRKHEGLARDGQFSDTDVGLEVADVLLYVIHLANVLGVDLAGSVTEKERINHERHQQADIDAA